MSTQMNTDSTQNLAFDNIERLFPQPQSSSQIKSILGRYDIREKDAIDFAMHQKSEKYKTDRQLSLAHAQSLVKVAQVCAVVEQDEETQLWLKFAESEDCCERVGPDDAVHLSRATLDTVISEGKLLQSKLRESQLMTSILEDAVSENRVHEMNASCQLGKLLLQLDNLGVQIPSNNGTSKPVQIPADHLWAYKAQVDAYLQAKPLFGENRSNLSASGSDHCS